MFDISILWSPLFLLGVCVVSGLAAVTLYMKNGASASRLLSIGILLVAAGSTVYMLSRYYPPLQALFTRLPTVDSLLAAVTPAIQFVKDNVYGVAMGALSALGVAWKAISSLKKTAADNLALVTSQASETQETLLSKISILSDEKAQAESKVEDAQRHVAEVTSTMMSQTQEFTGLQTEFAKLQAELAAINATV